MLSGCDKDSQKAVRGRVWVIQPICQTSSVYHQHPPRILWSSKPKLAFGQMPMEMWWVGLESQPTPPCPLCCCTLTSSLLREGTAAPAASQLVMWEAMEALGESSDGAHLPEVTTGAVQPRPPMEMSMETSVQSHFQRLNEVMGKPIPLAFHGFPPLCTFCS